MFWLGADHGAGQGLGKALIQKAAQAAREHFGAETIVLHAQCSAEGFYQRLGFRRTSSAFVEAGIPYVAMACPVVKLLVT
ncbi:GNAT family N-acetyltransferase [Pseudoramibacter faecis]|uniref:GNAT family N-acetyltransferase n=1 Tax=Pseudoramibacter faecis TaxID=3108534 RepID=UPI003CC9577D